MIMHNKEQIPAPYANLKCRILSIHIPKAQIPKNHNQGPQKSQDFVIVGDTPQKLHSRKMTMHMIDSLEKGLF